MTHMIKVLAFCVSLIALGLVVSEIAPERPLEREQALKAVQVPDNPTNSL